MLGVLIIIGGSAMIDSVFLNQRFDWLNEEREKTEPLSFIATELFYRLEN